MLVFLLQRIALLVIMVWGVLTFSFFLVSLAPGDVVETMVGQHTDAAVLENLRREAGLDQHPLRRYWRYLCSLGRGDWGISTRYRQPVWELVWLRFPHTLMLAACAIVVASGAGVLLGAVASQRPGSLLDRTILLLSLAGISVPVFYLGLLVVWVFALQLRWLPPAGYQSGDLRYLVLPVLVLATRSMAMITRMTRSALLEEYREQYLLTARAKGLSRLATLLKHALRNAALPIVTVIGLDLGSYLSGSVLTEQVFGWPGLGRLVVDAILARDIALINACIVLMALVYILTNLVIDVCYAWLDPRVRHG